MDYNGFVKNRGKRFYIDRRKKLPTLISNEIILQELSVFLKKNYHNPIKQKLRLLDVGAGTKPYSIIYKNYFSDCLSSDVSYSPHNISTVDMIAPADKIPLENNTIDFILCTEVLEHVPDPQKVLIEFNRILKPQGFVFLTTPFLVSLHEMPHDYYRYTPSALKYLSENANLKIKALYSRGDYFAVLLNMLLFPFGKFFRALQKLFKIPIYNPLSYLIIVLPQLLYLKYWNYARQDNNPSLFSKIYKKLDYHTLGYITIIEKT